MAEQFLLPKRLTRRFPALRSAGLRLDALFVRAIVGFLRLLPVAAALAIARGVMRMLGPLLPMHDKVLRNLRIAFPERDDAEHRRLRRQVFANLGAAFAELALAERIWREREARLEFVADPALGNLRPGAPAMVMVTAHVGAWQFANFVSARYGFALSTLYAEESNPFLAPLVLELRQTLRCGWLSNSGSMRRILEELRGGCSVGFASDTRQDQGEELPFFGHPAATNTIPARIALREGLDLVPVRAERLPKGRYRITLEAPVRPRNPDAGQAEQVTDMALQLNARYEDWIRRSPGEWMCLARRWPKERDKRAAR